MMVSTEILAFIEEYVRQFVGASVSPGFTWGKSGNVSSNTYLLNDSVPSNKAGRVVPVDGTIAKIFVACENDATGTIGIYENTGSSFVLLASISLTSQRKKVQSYDVDVDEEDELVAKVISGSFKNPVIGVSITQRVDT